MHGNVMEQCQDWYGEKYYSESPKADPPGPAKGGAHVLRGGSWNNNENGMRSAVRVWNIPSLSYNYFGFRCVLVDSSSR